MIRVYVPTTVAGLADLQQTGRVPGPLVAHAVTAAVRTEWADSGEEEWEYEALCLAADDCRELWSEVAAADRRRIVLAADVATSAVEVSSDAADPTLVRIAHDVPLKRIAAIHADLTAADAGDDDDLCWFATQELDQLL